MKNLLVTDLHLDLIRANQYRWDIFSFLRKMITKHSVDTLYILGDLTEKSNKHDAVLVNRIIDELLKLLKHCVIYLLVGNHDYFDRSSPFFEFISKFEVHNDYDEHNFICFVNEPKLDEDIKGLFIPHGYFSHDLLLKEKSIRYVYMHEDIKGFKYESGKDTNGLDLSELRDKLIIFNGHIHRPQRKEDVICIGSPYPIRFNDLGGIKGSENLVYILDELEGTISFFHTNIMNRRKIVLSPYDFKDGFIDLEKFIGDDERNQFKFELKLLRGETYKYPEYVSIIKRICKANDIEYCGCQCNILKEETKNKKKKIRKQEESFEDILKRYVEKENLSEKQLELALILMEE